MNETLKRAISGTVYIVLLLFCIHYNVLSYFVLFGFFLVIAVFEFCNLIKVNKIVPISLALLAFLSYTYILFSKLIIIRSYEVLFLIITIYVSIRAILFLFNDSKTELSIFNKTDFLLGYVIFPFIILAKIPFGENNQ